MKPIHNKAKGKKEKIVKGWYVRDPFDNYHFTSSTFQRDCFEAKGFKVIREATLHIKPCRNNRKGMRG